MTGSPPTTTSSKGLPCEVRDVQHEEARDGYRGRRASHHHRVQQSGRRPERPRRGRRRRRRRRGKTFTIAMVTHEAPGSTFWDRIRAGAEQAAEQHGINLKYSNDPELPVQATLVQNAIDSQVDAIAVTLAFPDAVGPTLQKATQAGIPGMVFNSGLDKYQHYGTLRSSARMKVWPVRAPASGRRGLRRQGPLRGARAGQRSLETRCAGVAGAPRTPRTCRSTARICRRSIDHPGQAGPGPVDHPHRHPRRRRRRRRRSGAGTPAATP